MFKYLIFFALLVGCGAPQTPPEVKAESMLSEFMISCKQIYGTKCESNMTVTALVESKKEQTCWIEDGTTLKHLVLNKDSVIQDDRIAIYQLMFDCNMNLSNYEKDILMFNDFALALGLTQ